jgi:hypothetical protein
MLPPQESIPGPPINLSRSSLPPPRDNPGHDSPRPARRIHITTPPPPIAIKIPRETAVIERGITFRFERRFGNTSFAFPSLLSLGAKCWGWEAGSAPGGVPDAPGTQFRVEVR